MEPAQVTIFAIIIGFTFGLLLGWFFGSRPAADLRQRFLVRDGEARDLDEKFRRAITELSAASVKAEQPNWRRSRPMPPISRNRRSC
jgi:DNA recombination protein RmuC